MGPALQESYPAVCSGCLISAAAGSVWRSCRQCWRAYLSDETSETHHEHRHPELPAQQSRSRPRKDKRVQKPSRSIALPNLLVRRLIMLNTNLEDHRIVCLIRRHLHFYELRLSI